MTRFLLILMLVFAIIWWFRRPPTRDTAADLPAKEPKPQNLLKCTRCGIAFPTSEAFRDPQHQPFCCAEHLSAQQGQEHPPHG